MAAKTAKPIQKSKKLGNVKPLKAQRSLRAIASMKSFTR